MYITTYKKEKPQFKADTTYANLLNQTEEFYTPIKFYKTTLKIDKPSTTLNYKILQPLLNAIEEIYTLLEKFKDTHTEEYYEFQIPKKSGGLRTIDAPTPEFKEALSKTKEIFERKIKCLPHKAAYAYIKNTSVYDAIEQHQKNKSNWYLKIDLKNFFPSCSPELIFNQLIQLYPFYYLPKNHQQLLKEIIDICCLRNGLPQGTPMSPLLTNLLMVPYDYEIYKLLTRGTGEHFVYTRYADDILISSKKAFNWQELQEQLNKILQPFTINKEKTRYGSRAGSNWNLGLMLNKDNNITLGHIKKKTLNAILNNLLKDYANGIKWPKEDIYSAQGKLGYLHHVEPEYFEYILNKYETKYDISLKQILKNEL